uniref:Uncharacterized protein n=1 Tax=Plectus sambesii TaxID=2011161 RepID=A0A914VQE2_9BILA
MNTTDRRSRCSVRSTERSSCDAATLVLHPFDCRAQPHDHERADPQLNHKANKRCDRFEVSPLTPQRKGRQGTNDDDEHGDSAAPCPVSLTITFSLSSPSSRPPARVALVGATATTPPLTTDR